MNILYISHLGSDKAAGLYYSVPAGVAAQQKYDNVLWVNTRNCRDEHFTSVKAYHCLDEYGKKLSLNILPSPFNRPDVVVFEGFYHPEAVTFARQLRCRNVPYIIIPRGSLTHQAFRNHNYLNYLKKKIACLFVLKRYTKKALAVQFLTQAEQHDSGHGWNNNTFVLPNGITIPQKQKTTFSNSGIRGVYIGRPSLLHKGLDMLIAACSDLKNEMIEHDFTIDLHLPKKNDYEQVVSMVEAGELSDILRIKPAVYGHEKEQALLDADVFIMTSRFEGHPMGLLEALSYGLPVAVTDGSNMADEVREAGAGWTAHCDKDDIVRMLREVMRSRGDYEAKSENARQLSTQYEWSTIASKFHDIIKEQLHSSMN